LNITNCQLNHFVLVAQELHFRRAADIGNIAQPALSRSIRTLENEIGFELFNRSKRNVELTEAGKTFLEGAVITLQLLDSGISNAQSVEHQNSSSIRIGFTAIAFCGESLAGLLKEFQNKYPDINLETVTIDSNEILKQLHHGELDFGFLTTSNHLKELNTVPFQKNRFVIRVSSDHLLAASGKITLEQLQKEKIIMSGLPQCGMFTEQAQQMIRNTGYKQNVELISQLPQAINDLVVLGRGVAISADDIAYPNDFRITQLELAGVEDQIQTVMAWKRDMQCDPCNHFLKLVLESLPSEESVNSNMPASKRPNMLELENAS